MLWDRTRDTVHPLAAVGKALNHSPRGISSPLIVCSLHHSIWSQLEWTYSWRKSLTRSWPVLVNSVQEWASARKVCGTRPLTYGKVMWLTGHSSGNTTQCEHIGRSMVQSWFNGVVLWSRLRETISVQLIVDPCKGYAWKTLNSPKSFFNNTNYQVIL